MIMKFTKLLTCFPMQYLPRQYSQRHHTINETKNMINSALYGPCRFIRLYTYVQLCCNSAVCMIKDFNLQ